MTQVNILGALEDQDVSSYLRDGGGNIIGFKDLSGSPVPVTNNVFASAPAMLADTPAENTVAFLSAAAFTGTGKRTKPLPMIYTAGLWRPFHDFATLFKAQFGTQVTPTMSLSAVGVYPFPSTIKIPGGLVKDGDSLWVTTRTQKHGTVGAAAVRCRLGTSATDTNNPLLFQIAPVQTPDLGGQTLISETVRTSNTSLFTMSNGTLNANHSGGFFADKTTFLDFSIDQYLVYSVTTLAAGDSVDLLSIKIVLESGSLQ